MLYFSQIGCSQDVTNHEHANSETRTFIITHWSSKEKYRGNEVLKTNPTFHIP
jgi:hypothetical protein